MQEPLGILQFYQFLTFSNILDVLHYFLLRKQDFFNFCVFWDSLQNILFCPFLPQNHWISLIFPKYWGSSCSPCSPYNYPTGFGRILDQNCKNSELRKRNFYKTFYWYKFSTSFSHMIISYFRLKLESLHLIGVTVHVICAALF